MLSDEDALSPRLGPRACFDSPADTATLGPPALDRPRVSIEVPQDDSLPIEPRVRGIDNSSQNDTTQPTGHDKQVAKADEKQHNMESNSQDQDECMCLVWVFVGVWDLFCLFFAVLVFGGSMYVWVLFCIPVVYLYFLYLLICITWKVPGLSLLVLS